MCIESVFETQALLSGISSLSANVPIDLFDLFASRHAATTSANIKRQHVVCVRFIVSFLPEKREQTTKTCRDLDRSATTIAL